MTIEKTACTFYLDGKGVARNVSFKLPRCMVQFCKLADMEEDEIINLAQSIKNEKGIETV